MKNRDKLIYKIFMGLMLMALPLQMITAASESISDMAIEKMLKDKFEGGWSYTVEGAPEGYKEGFLLIIKDGDSYKAQIQTGGGTMVGENVITKGSTIMFDVMVEGDKVAVNLKVNGSAISGTSTSSQGSYIISGTKTLSQD